MHILSFPKRVVAWPKRSAGQVELVGKGNVVLRAPIESGTLVCGRWGVGVDQFGEIGNVGYLAGRVDTAWTKGSEVAQTSVVYIWPNDEAEVSLAGKKESRAHVQYPMG
jgi:hypothetical protein